MSIDVKQTSEFIQLNTIINITIYKQQDLFVHITVSRIKLENTMLLEKIQNKNKFSSKSLKVV